jgi:hypothetical protein
MNIMSVFEFVTYDLDYSDTQNNLPVIYGLPFDLHFVRLARTATCAAETTGSSSSSSSSSSGARVSFVDEVKLALPHVLHPKLHLLFTVVSLEKDKKTGLKAVILGYAFYSLLSKGKYELTHAVILFIAGLLLFPASYLSGFAWLVDGRPRVTWSFLSSTHCKMAIFLRRLKMQRMRSLEWLSGRWSSKCTQ